jgi:hypothetical protein
MEKYLRGQAIKRENARDKENGSEKECRRRELRPQYSSLYQSEDEGVRGGR